MWDRLGKIATIATIIGFILGLSLFFEQSTTFPKVAAMLSSIPVSLLERVITLLLFSVLWICLWRQNFLKKQIEEHINKEAIKDLDQKPTQEAVKKDWAVPTPEAQRVLVNALVDYSSEPTRVSIVFVAPFHHPLASILASAFELAKWQTNFNHTPQDSFLRRYIPGIQVSGLSKVLVEAVATALKNAGLSAIKAIVTETQIERDTQKWRSAQRSIDILIGYYE